MLGHNGKFAQTHQSRAVSQHGDDPLVRRRQRRTDGGGYGISHGTQAVRLQHLVGRGALYGMAGENSVRADVDGADHVIAQRCADGREQRRRADALFGLSGRDDCLNRGAVSVESLRWPGRRRFGVFGEQGEIVSQVSEHLPAGREHAIILRRPVEREAGQIRTPGVEPGIAQLDCIETDKSQVIGLANEFECVIVDDRAQPESPER